MKNVLTLTNLIALAIIFSFIVQIIFPEYTEAFCFSPQMTIFEIYRIFTYSFLHASVLHLVLNVYALLIFGNLIEKQVGKKQMITIFILGSIAAIFGHIFSASIGLETMIKIVGASGAISALLGASAFLIPKTDVNVFFIKMKVQTVLMIFVVYEIVATLGIFTIEANAVHSAHFAALCFGYIYQKYITKKSTERN